MAAKKGHIKKGGRTKGTPNQFTSSVKEAFQLAFNELQSDGKVNLAQWGKENPNDFYRLASKLIPTEIVGNLTTDISLDFGK